MSVTSRGPRTPVVRLITPSGEVNLGDPAGGVTQPFTQLRVAAPRVGGGEAGGFGGATSVGEAVPDPVGAMTAGEDVGGCSTSGVV
jgi:hypothetical protein